MRRRLAPGAGRGQGRGCLAGARLACAHAARLRPPCATGPAASWSGLPMEDTSVAVLPLCCILSAPTTPPLRAHGIEPCVRAGGGGWQPTAPRVCEPFFGSGHRSFFVFWCVCGRARRSGARSGSRARHGRAATVQVRRRRRGAPARRPPLRSGATAWDSSIPLIIAGGWAGPPFQQSKGPGLFARASPRPLMAHASRSSCTPGPAFLGPGPSSAACHRAGGCCAPRVARADRPGSVSLCITCVLESP